MSQTASPATLTTADWTGTAAALADGSDATYLESPATPINSQTFLCALTTVADAGTTARHQLRVRAVVSPAASEPLDLVLALENVDDASVVATRAVTVPPDALADTVITLTAAEAAAIHNYAALQVRGYGRDGAGTAFVWAAVSEATSYVLQIGTATLLSDVFSANVGNNLDFSVVLQPGTYYARVVVVGGAHDGELTLGGEQTVVVA